MPVFIVTLVYLAWAFGGAFAEYVGGRIILPAIGLTAPHYSTWFWFMVWTGLVGLVGLAFKALVRRLVVFLCFVC